VVWCGVLCCAVFDLYSVAPCFGRFIAVVSIRQPSDRMTYSHDNPLFSPHLPPNPLLSSLLVLKVRYRLDTMVNRVTFDRMIDALQLFAQPIGDASPISQVSENMFSLSLSSC
jgi:hypothetical protein